jgi:aminoglycoside 2''-phosphotransferase
VSIPLPPLSELKEAARAAWPERRLERFRVNDEGWANLVLEADDCVIFRIPRRREVAESLGFELRALELLSHYLSTPIPAPVRFSVLRRPRGWPFMAYPRLPGIPLSEVGSIDSVGKRRLGEFIRTLLTELGFVPPRSLLRIGARPGTPRDWEKRYRQLQSRFYRVTEPTVPPHAQQAVSEAFGRFYGALRGARYRAVATHLDLGPYNILWDTMSNRPTGIIDWEDLRLGDPAFDLTSLAGLGRSRLRALTQARRGPGDSTFDERLAFYRQMVPLHDFVSAAEIGNLPMVRKYATYLNANFHE